MILRQRYLDQSYQDRMKSLGLIPIEMRREYLNLSFVAKLLISPRSDFMKDFLDMFLVNCRHTDVLTFHHNKARTEAYKHCGVIRFPKAFLSWMKRLVTVLYQILFKFLGLGCWRILVIFSLGIETACWGHFTLNRF